MLSVVICDTLDCSVVLTFWFTTCYLFVSITQRRTKSELTHVNQLSILVHYTGYGFVLAWKLKQTRCLLLPAHFVWHAGRHISSFGDVRCCFISSVIDPDLMSFYVLKILDLCLKLQLKLIFWSNSTIFGGQVELQGNQSLNKGIWLVLGIDTISEYIICKFKFDCR